MLLFGTTAPGADEARARTLINSLGCKGCHLFEGSGGSLGPPLDRIGLRLDSAQISRKLVDPKGTDPQSTMPAFDQLDRDDLETLADFLARQRP